MPEALFVNTAFSLGVTQWQNQKEVLPGNKAAYLASLEESPTSNEDLKIAGISSLFVCFMFFDMSSLSLSVSWYHSLVTVSHWNTEGTLFSEKLYYRGWKLICLHLLRYVLFIFI